jgi:hypothetical protein
MIREEPDRVRAWPIIATLFATVVVIATCALLVSQLARRGDARTDLLHVERATPFSTPTDPEMQRGSQYHSLDQWQWTDDTHTRVRVPVDDAIERYLAKEGAR